MNIIRTMREERGTASRGKHYEVVDAESCGSKVDWYGEVVCEVENARPPRGPGNPRSCGAVLIFVSFQPLYLSFRSRSAHVAALVNHFRTPHSPFRDRKSVV